MAFVRFIWILVVCVLFGVFSEGVPIDEAPITTDMDISNSGLDPSARSLYEHIELPDSRRRFNIGILDEEDTIKKVEGIPAPTVNILSPLHGDRRNGYWNEAVNVETSNVLSPKSWRSSGLKLEELGESANDNEGEAEAEKNPILRETNNIPRTFEDSIEMTDNTVSHDDIVHIGPANFDREPLNVNILNTRHERETETTESDKEDVFEVDSSGLMDNINTIGLGVNDVPNIGRQIFVNKVTFRVQVQMEYDTDNIPPDIKTDEILDNLNFNQSPAEEIANSDTQKEASVSLTSPENTKKIILRAIGRNGRKSLQSNAYGGKQISNYNSKRNVYDSQQSNDDIVDREEYSTEFATSSRNMHNKEISIDVDATTNTPRVFGKGNAIKIFPRSDFADGYPSASNENAADISAATTDDVDTNEGSTMDSVTGTHTPQHTSFRSGVSRDITVGGTPEVGEAEAMMEKRLERFMFMEMGLGVVIILSSVTTVIQIMVLVKKLKGISNRYECAAVP